MQIMTVPLHITARRNSEGDIEITELGVSLPSNSSNLRSIVEVSRNEAGKFCQIIEEFCDRELNHAFETAQQDLTLAGA